MKNRLKIPVPEPLPPTVLVAYTDDQIEAGRREQAYRLGMAYAEYLTLLCEFGDPREYLPAHYYQRPDHMQLPFDGALECEWFDDYAPRARLLNTPGKVAEARRMVEKMQAVVGQSLAIPRGGELASDFLTAHNFYARCADGFAIAVAAAEALARKADNYPAPHRDPLAFVK